MLTHLTRFFQKRESLTIGLIFSINSFLFGNWVTRIPDIKASLQLSEGELGLALTGGPIGSILITPLAGIWINKLGIGKTCILSLFLSVFISFSPAIASNFSQLCIALFFCGASGSFLGITMNAAAAVTERKLKYPIMSTCHGMWSLGAMAGALVGSLVAGFGVVPSLHLMLMAVLIALLALPLLPQVIKYRDEVQNAAAFQWPKKAVLGLAAIGFCIYLGEGAIADWSAIYMKETLRSNPYLVGLAFSAFALMMAVGRFAGDAVIPRFGNRQIVGYGALLAAIGLCIALLFSSPLLAILGFAMTGLGFSCIVPVVMSASANIPGISAGSGIAIVATIGTSGFLVGPPLIGLIAELSSLRLALGLVGLLCFSIYFTSGRIKLK